MVFVEPGHKAPRRTTKDPHTQSDLSRGGHKCVNTSGFCPLLFQDFLFTVMDLKHLSCQGVYSAHMGVYPYLSSWVMNGFLQ